MGFGLFNFNPSLTQQQQRGGGQRNQTTLNPFAFIQRIINGNTNNNTKNAFVSNPTWNEPYTIKQQFSFLPSYVPPVVNIQKTSANSGNSIIGYNRAMEASQKLNPYVYQFTMARQEPQYQYRPITFIPSNTKIATQFLTPKQKAVIARQKAINKDVELVALGATAVALPFVGLPLAEGAFGASFITDLSANIATGAVSNALLTNVISKATTNKWASQKATEQSLLIGGAIGAGFTFASPAISSVLGKIGQKVTELRTPDADIAEYTPTGLTLNGEDNSGIITGIAKTDTERFEIYGNQAKNVSLEELRNDINSQDVVKFAHITPSSSLTDALSNGEEVTVKAPEASEVGSRGEIFGLENQGLYLSVSNPETNATPLYLKYSGLITDTSSESKPADASLLSRLFNRAYGIFGEAEPEDIADIPARGNPEEYASMLTEKGGLSMAPENEYGLSQERQIIATVGTKLKPTGETVIIPISNPAESEYAKVPLIGGALSKAFPFNATLKLSGFEVEETGETIFRLTDASTNLGASLTSAEIVSSEKSIASAGSSLIPAGLATMHIISPPKNKPSASKPAQSQYNSMPSLNRNISLINRSPAKPKTTTSKVSKSASKAIRSFSLISTTSKPSKSKNSKTSSGSTSSGLISTVSFTESPTSNSTQGSYSLHSYTNPQSLTSSANPSKSLHSYSLHSYPLHSYKNPQNLWAKSKVIPVLKLQPSMFLPIKAQRKASARSAKTNYEPSLLAVVQNRKMSAKELAKQNAYGGFLNAVIRPMINPEKPAKGKVKNKGLFILGI